MTAAPWFKFYASDYLLDEDVDMVPLEAQAILVRLWCLCWRSTVIPASPEVLAVRAKVDVRAMKRHWVCLQPFFSKVEGGMVSPRLERERDESRAKSEGHRFGAQKTNEKRWGKRSLSDSPSDHLVSDVSVTKRITKRVAKVSPSESESESEKNDSPNGESCSEAKKQASLPDPSPVVGFLPCVGKGQHEWPVTELMLAEWGRAFPGVDLMPEVEKMRLWLNGNPDKRKTFRGMPSFALRWLGKAQDSARGGYPNQRPQARTSRAVDADASFLTQLDNLAIGA